MLARILFSLVALFAAPLGYATPAQDFPTRPVRLVVPFPAGGGADAVGRLLAEALSKRWNQSVIVDNRGGASTILGTQNVAKSAPDGYTLLLAPDLFATNAASRQDLPYDPLRDFAPVTKGIEFPILLIASLKSGLHSIGDIVKAAKRTPGQLTAGSLGETSIHFLGFRLFQRAAGIELTDVPYKGSGPAMIDLLGGQIDLMFAGISGGMSSAGAGRAAAIATTGRKRDPAAPAVPTFVEAGYPDIVVMGWMSILAPARTPDALVARLNADIVQVLNDPSLSSKLAEMGFTSTPSSAKELDDYIRSEIQRIKALAGDPKKAAGN